MVSRAEGQTPKCCTKGMWIQSLVQHKIVGKCRWDVRWSLMGKNTGRTTEADKQPAQGCPETKGLQQHFKISCSSQCGCAEYIQRSGGTAVPMGIGVFFSFLSFFYGQFIFSDPQLKLPTVVWMSVGGKPLPIMTSITVIMPSTNQLWTGDERNRNFLGLGVK